MLCTLLSDFKRLSNSRFNVVLQNTAPKEDDGSLSRLAALRDIRYVNIESGFRNREKTTGNAQLGRKALP